MIVTPGPGDFFRLNHIPSSAKKWIRYDIPNEYRYYDSEGDVGYWYVHKSHLLAVIELAYKSTGHVDWSALPPYLQIEAAREKENWKVNRSKSSQTNIIPTTSLREAYATLYLLPSAPSSVVSSVWRSLAKSSHPDHGGDAELFRRYSEAYSLIKKEDK